MTTQTPAERLRATAADIREKAGAATPGPWRVIETWDGDVFGVDDGRWVGTSYTDPDRAYITTMHPAVGLALATILDNAMAEVDSYRDNNQPFDIDDDLLAFIDAYWAGREVTP